MSASDWTQRGDIMADMRAALDMMSADKPSERVAYVRRSALEAAAAETGHYTSGMTDRELCEVMEGATLAATEVAGTVRVMPCEPLPTLPEPKR